MSIADDAKRSKIFTNSQLNNNEERSPSENNYVPVHGMDRTVSAVDLAVDDDDEILSTLSNRSDLS